MDSQTTPQALHETRKGRTPWGLLIGLLLILVIIVSAAYHVLTERIGANTPASEMSY